MKKYLAHMHTKTPHELRQHAALLAMGVTALVFVGWVITLGVRLQDTSANTAAAVEGLQVSPASVLPANQQ